MAAPKTALVLSSGGMFGAYQAGAWQIIAKTFQPDIVVGASVGALNGWVIAGGASPETLIERWRDPLSGDTLKLLPDPGWHWGSRSRWFDPEPLRAQAEQLHREFTPKIPFGVVVVRLPKMETVLIEHPLVLPAHLQATCAIPVFLPAVKIAGQRHLDGGIFEKLPVWAAVKMGATRIVAIDALPPSDRWWLRAGSNTVRLFKPRRRLPASLDLTVLSPSEPLGTANDAVFWKRENIERWIELGARDAARALAEPAHRAA